MNNKETTSAYKETFFIVPRHILELPDLTFSYLKVFETIFQFWNKDQPCFLSNPCIQERTGVCNNMVKSALNYFENKGLLKRVQKGTKRYLVQPVRAVLTDIVQEGAPPPCLLKIKQEGAPPPSPGRSTALHQGATAPTEIKNLNKENKKRIIVDNNLSSPKNGTAKQSQKRDTEPKRREPKKESKNTIVETSFTTNSRFEEFWKEYPNKVEKKKSLEIRNKYLSLYGRERKEL